MVNLTLIEDVNVTSKLDCIWHDTNPMCGHIIDIVDLKAAFISEAPLPEGIRNIRFTAKSPAKQPKVGDYNCLFFISIGSIFILFTIFFSENQLI